MYFYKIIFLIITFLITQQKNIFLERKYVLQIKNDDIENIKIIKKIHNKIFKIFLLHFLTIITK